MTSPEPVRPLWAGRGLALLGILLVALNVRTAVSSLSPIAERVGAEILVDGLGLGLIGALPPVAFALSGILAPWVARRIGLDAALVVACVAMVIGPVLRGVAPSYVVLVVGSTIALFGMGFGNVLLPPAVKRYFRDRIGVVTSAYVAIVALSTAAPAVLAEPVASTAGWRVSLGIWAVLAACALVPWIVLAVRARRQRRAEVDPLPHPARLHGIWRSRVAWSITIVFLVSAMTVYAMFAWLPLLLVEHVGVTAAQAGALLGLLAALGLPGGVLGPLLATRVRNVGLVVVGALVINFIGFIGLWLLPAGVVLWIVLIGSGGIVFPVCLVLINTRTRTERGATSLSGFAQAVGYTGGALGPLLVGFLYEVSGGGTVPIIALALMLLIAVVPGLALAKPRMVEDELAERH